MMKEQIKKIISLLPGALANYCEAIARKVIRFFDGRDLADKMTDFNQLSKTKNLKKSADKERVALIYNVYYQHQDQTDLYNLLYRYESFSEEIRKWLEIIIVDDGSPCPIQLPEINLNMTLLRILKDIPWNGGGARNLGALYTTAPKLLFCDLDHFVPEDTIRYCIETEMKANAMYLLEWKEPVYVPPNIFCITRGLFLRSGGYDEAYSGFYGDDVFFRKYMEECGISFVRTGWTVSTESQGGNYLGEHNLRRNLFKARNQLRKQPFLAHSHQILRFPWRVIEKRYF